MFASVIVFAGRTVVVGCEASSEVTSTAVRTGRSYVGVRTDAGALAPDRGWGIVFFDHVSVG
jgi:hypothetical protein